MPGREFSPNLTILPAGRTLRVLARAELLKIASK
jgi:hypothetical protein